MAYSKAIAQSHRPIWLTISWALDEDYISDWQQYSNARRIEGDVECEGDCPLLTEWPRIEVRFLDLPSWEHTSGPTLGWNDLDSLEVGNDPNDGITDTEQQTAMTLWAMANAPLTLGGDLTKLTSFGKQALTNDEVLAVDRSGHPATQINAGFTQVWASNLGNGCLLRRALQPQRASLQRHLRLEGPWLRKRSQGARSVGHTELGPHFNSISTVLPGHGARLFLVQGTRQGSQLPPSQVYDGASAILHGAANIQPCTLCASGSKITYLGIGPDNYATFADVEVKKAGVYRMEVDSLTNGTRSYIINVNGGPNMTLNSSGGSGNVPSQLTIPVKLNAGINSIQFGNPVSYPPDLDRIVISGDGNEPYPTATTYEGEYATLTGSASGGFCGNCSGLAKAGNLGVGATATFTNVNVPAAGTYNMEIDYLTSGPRSYFLSVNDGTSQELDLNGSQLQLACQHRDPGAVEAGNNSHRLQQPHQLRAATWTPSPSPRSTNKLTPHRGPRKSCRGPRFFPPGLGHPPDQRHATKASRPNNTRRLHRCLDGQSCYPSCRLQFFLEAPPYAHRSRGRAPCAGRRYPRHPHLARLRRIQRQEGQRRRSGSAGQPVGRAAACRRKTRPQCLCPHSRRGHRPLACHGARLRARR